MQLPLFDLPPAAQRAWLRERSGKSARIKEKLA
jgi:hypothetical protein